jgi:hypothetical protein
VGRFKRNLTGFLGMRVAGSLNNFIAKMGYIKKNATDEVHPWHLFFLEMNPESDS